MIIEFPAMRIDTDHRSAIPPFKFHQEPGGEWSARVDADGAMWIERKGEMFGSMFLPSGVCNMQFLVMVLLATAFGIHERQKNNQPVPDQLGFLKYPEPGHGV